MAWSMSVWFVCSHCIIAPSPVVHVTATSVPTTSSTLGGLTVTVTGERGGGRQEGGRERGGGRQEGGREGGGGREERERER